MFNAAVNNISVILKETEVPQKTTELLQFTDKHYHNVVSSTPCHDRYSNSQRQPLHHRCGFPYKVKLCLPQVLQHGGGPQQCKQGLSSTIK